MKFNSLNDLCCYNLSAIVNGISIMSASDLNRTRNLIETVNKMRAEEGNENGAITENGYSEKAAAIANIVSVLVSQDTETVLAVRAGVAGLASAAADQHSRSAPNHTKRDFFNQCMRLFWRINDTEPGRAAAIILNRAYNRFA